MRKTTAVVVCIGVAVAVAQGLAGCSHSSSDSQSGQSGGGKHAKGKNAGDGPIPVSVSPVTRQDMPIYLNGLGSVLAFNTATILAQVSGQLIQVPFKEGDELAKGDLVAQVDPRPFQATLDQAIAKRAQDRAALHSAELDLKRYKDLLPDGYVTGQQVDQQQATVDSDKALVQADEASIESARVQLSFTRIVAPFDCVAGIRQVDVGNLVSASGSTGIVVVTQIKPIAVTFTLPEQSLPQIRSADSQPLTVVAVTRDNQKVLASGTLTAFDSQIDTSTGTIKLKATFPNLDKKLWPGQFVNARLLVRTEHNALTVPAPAVQLGPDGSYVYVVGPDQAVKMQTVTVEQTEGNTAMIAKGLNEGDKVVIDGQSRLQPGSKVTLGGVDGGAGSSGSSGSSGGGGGTTSGSSGGSSSSSGGDAAGGDGQHHHHHHHDSDTSSGSSGGDGGSSGSGAAGGQQ